MFKLHGKGVWKLGIRDQLLFSEPNDIIVIANIIMFHRDILGKHLFGDGSFFQREGSVTVAGGKWK